MGYKLIGMIVLVPAFFTARGVSNTVREVVVIKVERALPVTSPAYDLGLTEAEIRGRGR